MGNPSEYEKSKASKLLNASANNSAAHQNIRRFVTRYTSIGDETTATLVDVINGMPSKFQFIPELCRLRPVSGTYDVTAKITATDAAGTSNVTSTVAATGAALTTFAAVAVAAQKVWPKETLVQIAFPAVTSLPANCVFEIELTFAEQN